MIGNSPEMHVGLHRWRSQGLRADESPADRASGDGTSIPSCRRISAISASALPRCVVRSHGEDTRFGTRSAPSPPKVRRGEGWGCDEIRDRCRKVHVLLHRMVPCAMRLSRRAVLVP